MPKPPDGYATYLELVLDSIDPMKIFPSKAHAKAAQAEIDALCVDAKKWRECVASCQSAMAHVTKDIETGRREPRKDTENDHE